jgi:hypothetical protein
MSVTNNHSRIKYTTLLVLYNTILSCIFFFDKILFSLENVFLKLKIKFQKL